MTRPVLIIPAHNRRATTLACLERLAANGDFENFEVKVIDDGSTDGTSEEIARRHACVQVERGDGSLYWGGAIAAGMLSALRTGPRALFWLNDDCLPRPGALPALAAALVSDPRSIVVPRCVVAKTGEAWPNGFIGRRRVTAAPDQIIALDGASGYCAGIGREVSSALGVVDAGRFPHYYADTAYTLVASRRGFRVRMIGSVQSELVDPGREDHLIRDHFDTRMGPWANARKIGLARTSPFRLPTMLALMQLKHGLVKGTVATGVKTAGWFGALLLTAARVARNTREDQAGK